MFFSINRVSGFVRMLSLAVFASALMVSIPASAQDDDERRGSSGSGSAGSGSSTDGGSVAPSHPLAESDTAYKGARMLTGGVDVEFGDVIPGTVGEERGIIRNARFIGNTLYAEALDENGNALAMIVEFYWFESSVPRGSDFFVGVVKARTIPHLAEDWVLEHDPIGPTDRFRPDRGATLYVRSTTDPDLSSGGFRWDWSLPFRDYSMDAYGTIRMRADYGVGVMANGVAQSAYQANEYGVEVKVDGQATGHLNNDYSVNTNYEITLHRWDVYTRNSSSMLEWSMFLRTHDRERRNAYHEFFIAMQVPEGEEYHIDALEVGGHVKHKADWWFDQHSAMSVAIQDIVIRRPEITVIEEDTMRRDSEDNNDDTPRRPWERARDDQNGDNDSNGDEWPRSDDYSSTHDAQAMPGGCSVSPSTSGLNGGTLIPVLLGLFGIARRRRS